MLRPLARWSAVLLAGVSASFTSAAEQPNLIFILADDLGYGELGCYGQTLIATPELDRMAEEGMRFTQFYAGSTVCAPSRSVLMTGQHTGHTRVRGNAGGRHGAQTLQSDDVTIARVLQQRGYRTGLVGKWGLGLLDEPGEPRSQGFDAYFGYLHQAHAHNHFPDHLWRDGERVALQNDLVQVGPVEGVGYATRPVQYSGDLFAEEALEFVRANRAQPFFLYLSVITPHANNERSKELGNGHEVPEFGRYADRPWPDTTKGHAAMITRLDAQIGRLFDELQRLGLDQRTLVIFTSDNGPHKEGGPEYDPRFFTASGPFRGLKRSLTDGGLRVPFLARWPGQIPAGAVSPHVGYFGDFFATFAELAGAPLPPDRDSLSLVPTLLGRDGQAVHEYLYWEFYEGGASQAVLLHGRWKGLRLSDGDDVILYDLQNDIGETTDVAPAHPELVARIREIMRTAHVSNEHWSLTPPAKR